MIIRGGTVVTARGVEQADIAIADGQIIEVGMNVDADGGEIDASGWHVCLDRLTRLLGGAQTAGQPAVDWSVVHRLYQQKFGPEAWAVLEKQVGNLS